MILKILDFKVSENTLAHHHKVFFEILSNIFFSRIAYFENHFDILELDSRIIWNPEVICFLLNDLPIDNNHLEKLNFGYALNENRKAINVTSDSFGIIDIPNVGFFIAQSNSDFVLEECNRHFHLDKEITERFEYTYNSIQFRPVLPKIAYENQNLDLLESPKTTFENNKTTIVNAFELIKNYSKSLFHMINKCVDSVVVYNAKNSNSFANINYHGVAFINIYQKKQNEIFFVDDLAHQCGHVIFNVLTLDAGNFLSIPKNTLIKSITRKSKDRRTIYDAFHGLFTYTCIIDILSNLYCHWNCSKENKNELLARIGFYMLKFRIDLGYLDHPEIFTDLGNTYFKQFVSGYKKIYERLFKFYGHFNFSNQDYIFDFKKFKEINNF